MDRGAEIVVHLAACDDVLLRIVCEMPENGHSHMKIFPNLERATIELDGSVCGVFSPCVRRSDIITAGRLKCREWLSCSGWGLSLEHLGRK